MAEKQKGDKVLSLTEKKHGRSSKNPGAEIILAEYADHTGAELAKKYGVSVTTIQTWVRKGRAELNGK